ITERVRMAERLQRLASTDELTQLRNRATYFADSEKRLRELAENGRGASVVMFDIDFFKNVNDMYGHGAGDAALASVAGAVREELRKTDIAGRYGGDEFLIFMPDTMAGEASQRAERIRRRIESLEIAAAGERIRVTSSFGVAYAAPGPSADGDALDRLMRDADVALYAAKKLGRNRVHLEE
ncbi:MAG TPA: GGDEF domain-containing protein, partial [Paenibacillus sp.]|nr:GGDEF domain-containing protein [Paenibacillus sp.]